MFLLQSVSKSFIQFIYLYQEKWHPSRWHSAPSSPVYRTRLLWLPAWHPLNRTRLSSLLLATLSSFRVPLCDIVFSWCLWSLCRFEHRDEWASFSGPVLVGRTETKSIAWIRTTSSVLQFQTKWAKGANAANSNLLFLSSTEDGDICLLLACI